MMKVRELSRGLGFGAAAALLLFMACAGKDPPEVSAELADAVRAAYDQPAAGAGGSGAGGSAAGTGAGAGGGAQAGGSGASGGAAAGAGNGGIGGGAMAGEAGSGGNGGGASAGAAGSAGSPPSCDGFAILATNCGTSGCHGEGSNLEDFAASEAAAREFIDQPGTLACSGQGLVIDSEEPSESLMIRKLADDAPCGQRMPVSGTPLSRAEVECIEDWIGSL